MAGTKGAWRAAFWVALLALLLVVHRGDPMNSDDGIVLAGAWDMWLGRRLYEDVFVWASPGSFYSVWTAWSLFGPSWEVAKLVGLASVLLAAWAVVCTAELLGARRSAYWLGALFALLSVGWPIVNYNVLSIPFLAWGTYFAARGCTDGRARSFVLAGLCSGLGVLYLQHRGIALGGTTALFCLFHAVRSGRTWIRRLAWYALGAILPLLLFLHWEPALLIDTLLVFPWERYQPDATHRETIAIYLSAWVLLLGVAWLLRRRLSVAGAYVLVVQGGLLAGAYRSWDWGHISYSLFPLFSVVAQLDWSADPPEGTSHRLWRFLVPVYYCVLAASAVLPSLRAALITQRVRDVRALPTLRFIDAHCSASPYLWAGPFLPGMYFYAKKVNPTRFSLLTARQNRPEHVAEVLAVLRRAPPPCVVRNYRLGAKWHTMDNDVDRFLTDHYRQAQQTQDTTAWVLADEPAAP